METEKIESLKGAIGRLQEELTQQRLITDTVAEESLMAKQQLESLQPLVEFVNSFDSPEQLRTILEFLKDDYLDSSEGELRPLKVEFSPYISKKLQEIAKTMGITEKEALKQLVEDNLRTMEKAEAKFRTMEKRSRT